MPEEAANKTFCFFQILSYFGFGQKQKTKKNPQKNPTTKAKKETKIIK